MPNRTAKFVVSNLRQLFSRAPLSQPYRTARRARRTIAFPHRRTKHLRAAIGTTASIAPPNAIAGISARKAQRSRRPPRRIRRHPQSRLHRKPKHRRSARSRTLTPNCLRRRASNSRTAALRRLPAVPADAAGQAKTSGRAHRDANARDRSSPRAGPTRPAQARRSIHRRMPEQSGGECTSRIAGLAHRDRRPFPRLGRSQQRTHRRKARPASLRMLLAVHDRRAGARGHHRQASFSNSAAHDALDGAGRACVATRSGNRRMTTASCCRLSPSADVVPRRTGFPRDLDRTGDANDRIAEFFSQLSRRAPS